MRKSSCIAPHIEGAFDVSGSRAWIRNAQGVEHHSDRSYAHHSTTSLAVVLGWRANLRGVAQGADTS